MLTQPALQEADLLRDRAFADGTWIEADSGETFPVVDPATGEELTGAPRMGAAETRRALEAARDAYPAWRTRTAQGALICKYRNSGQTCISANRILVQDPVYEDFLAGLTVAVSGLKVGAGTEPDANVGPLIDEAALAKVERHVENALEGGAEVEAGGSRHELGGTFFQPTVLTGVTAEMAMSCEETFGPVAGLQRFSTEEDAIRIANDTPYGLAMYFYSRDVGRIWRVAEAAEYGILGINTGLISTEVAPFGGMKESGIGREGSKYRIDEWLEIKYLAIGGI